jgi:hypothetical protein
MLKRVASDKHASLLQKSMDVKKYDNVGLQIITTAREENEAQ